MTKTKTLLTHVPPIMGVPDGKGSPDPAIRQAWLDQRAGGITATEIRDWGSGSKRREIIGNKVTMHTEDLSHIPAIAHGNRREPVIAAWIEGKFGITPADNVYAHGENPRHLASPDGVTLDPLTRQLVVGAPAVLAEIKTSKHDLHPGRLDESRVLMDIDQDSHFARSNYYTQMQWQMYVMQATGTLFVWEQHDNIVDEETKTFTPLGPPQWAWIPRDELLIERLVNDVAPRALAEIDAARATTMPPVAADVPAEHAILVNNLLDARDQEAIWKKNKETAWAALQAFYLAEGYEDTKAPLDAGAGTITVSTSTKDETYVDVDAMKKRAPAAVAKYEELVKKFTKTRAGKPRRTLTVVRKKDEK